MGVLVLISKILPGKTKYSCERYSIKYTPRTVDLYLAPLGKSTRTRASQRASWSHTASRCYSHWELVTPYVLDWTLQTSTDIVYQIQGFFNLITQSAIMAQCTNLWDVPIQSGSWFEAFFPLSWHVRPIWWHTPTHSVSWIPYCLEGPNHRYPAVVGLQVNAKPRILQGPKVRYPSNHVFLSCSGYVNLLRLI